MKTPYISLSKNALIIALTAFCGNALYAQTDENKNAFNEEVVIEKQYKPKLSDAVKIDVVPLSENIETKKPAVAYKIPAFLQEQQPYKAKLKGLKMDKAPLDELYHNYVRAGYGNYNNIYAEAFYNTLRSKNGLLAVHGKHHSGNGPDSNSIFSEQIFDIYGKRIFKGHSLQGLAGYQRNANRFYGQLPSDTLDRKDSTRNRFNDFHISADFAKIKADTGKFNYGAGLSFYNFNDLYLTNETAFGASLYGIEPFKGNSIRFDASYNYWRYTTSKFTDNRNLAKIGVNYQFKYNSFRALAGFITANQSDSAESTFHFFPNVNAEADVVPKYFTAYAGITGNIEPVSYKSIARENPFIASIQPLKNTTERLNIYGGAKGSFSSNSYYNVGASYKTYRYLPFFVNDSVDSRKFLLVFDSSAKVFNFYAQAGITVLESLEIGTGFNYNKYTLSNLKRPFHKPSIDVNLSARYTIANKITVGTEVFFMDTRYGGAFTKDSLNNPITEIQKLDPVIDINLNASYKFANIPGLSAHIELNNILGNKYQLWNYYPTRGFQVMGGLSYSFLPPLKL